MVVVSVLVLCTAGLTPTEPLRACLLVCVTAVCVSVSFGARGVCGAVPCRLARDLPETSAAHPMPKFPSLGCVTAGLPETLLSTRGPLLYRQTSLSGPIFRRTWCQECRREDMMARMRPLRSPSTFRGGARSHYRSPRNPPDVEWSTTRVLIDPSRTPV